MDLYHHRPGDSLIQQPVATERLSVRSVLQVDAVLGIGSGGALVVAGGWLATAADLASAGPLRAIGVFLLLYGIGLAWSSRRPAAFARRAVVATAVADIMWVATSLAVAAVVDLPLWATGLVVVQAGVVAAIAAAKHHVTR